MSVSETSKPVYAATVRQAIKVINPAVTSAAQACGWPAAFDAVSTLLISLLIAAVGGEEARAACGRMYEEVARLEDALVPLLELAADSGVEPQGRA
ncbi:MAG TPA: hypothetical protein VGM07_10865 [Stellaceae bacterium]